MLDNLNDDDDDDDVFESERCIANYTYVDIFNPIFFIQIFILLIV